MAQRERRPPSRSITFTGGQQLQAPPPAVKVAGGAAAGAGSRPAPRGGALQISPFAASAPPSPTTPQPYGQHRQAGPPVWEL
jgi:hypothetical protein